MSTLLDLRALAAALGGDVTGGQVLAPGPGHSPRDRSLAVKPCPTAPDGFVAFSHCGDDWMTCRDHVRGKLRLPAWEPGDGRERARTIHPRHLDKWDFAAVDVEAEIATRSEEDWERIERAQALWSEAGDPRGTSAEAYLRSRALVLHDDLAGSFRFHPRTPWRNEDTGRTDFIPCLLAAFRAIDDDLVTAVHRIRVDQPERWPKTQRRMLGVVHRAAVKLAPAGDELLIAEGVESAMAARELGITTPAWAVGSVGAISFFPLLEGVAKLSIHAEPGAVSERAVKICSRRWRRASRRVAVVRSTIGSDLNDALMARKLEAVP